jgi:hypothetical protein
MGPQCAANFTELSLFLRRENLRYRKVAQDRRRVTRMRLGRGWDPMCCLVGEERGGCQIKPNTHTRPGIGTRTIDTELSLSPATDIGFSLSPIPADSGLGWANDRRLRAMQLVLAQLVGSVPFG